MEYTEGSCLKHFLESDFGQSVHIDLAIIKNWTSQIANGLAFLHSKRILHCDLKSRNIMLNKKIDSLESLNTVTLKLSKMSFFSESISPSHAAPEVLRNYTCRKSYFLLQLWYILINKLKMNRFGVLAS